MNKKALALFWLAVGVLVLPIRVAQAQQQALYELTGSVTSTASGEPIAGAAVSVGETRSVVTTDASGRFVITLRPGTYTIRVSDTGYSTVERNVVLGPNPLDLHFSLFRSPITLPAIEVLRERTELGHSSEDVPGSVHVISREDVANHSLLLDDVHDVLRQIPGVTIQEEDGYGLRPNIGMRGTGTQRSSKITLMEDGVLIAPAPYAAPSAYYFPVVGRMSAIEVRKGSSQIKYGPRTIGGALNLVSTPIPDQLRLSADVVGGENTTRKLNASAGQSYDHFGWLAETYQIATDGFKQLDNGGNTGFDVRDYLVKVRLNSDRASANYQELELKFGFYDEVSNETYLGLTDDDFLLSPSRRYLGSQMDVMDAGQRQMSARYFLRLGDRFDLTTTAYRNDFERNWFKLQSVLGTKISEVLARPDDFENELGVLRGANSASGALRVRANNREYFGQGIQSVAGMRLDLFGVPHQVELGVRYHEDQEDRFQHEDSFQMVAGRMVLTAAGAPGSQSNRVSDARAVALFVRDEITFGDFVLSPGLRYESIGFTRTEYSLTDPERRSPERVRTNSLDALIPGFGVIYRLSPALRFFGGIHRGFGPPGPGADQATRAEQSVSYETGARFERSDVNVQVVGFFNDYGNVLGEATLSSGGNGSGALFNGGEVDVFGLEMSVNYGPLIMITDALPVRVPIGVALTYTSAKFANSFESDFEPWGTVQAGDRLPYLPVVQLHLSAGLESADWSFDVAADYQSEMRTVAGQGPTLRSETTDSYLVLNVSGEYSLGAHQKLFAGIRNVTDRRYVVARRPAGARPGLPRTLMLGVKFRY